MDPKTVDSIGVNQNNRNGWILCSSKTFPGKYYYFNVLSGEAAWCLSDNEKLKCPSKADNCQSYPEPSGVPNDVTTNTFTTSNFNTQPIYKPCSNFESQFATSTPLFERPMYPQYMPPYVPYVPQPWMAPMMLGNQRKYRPNVVETVHHTVPSFHETPLIMVQQTSVPLSQRFNQRLNIKRIISFDVKSKITKMVQTEDIPATEKAKVDGKIVNNMSKKTLSKSKCIVTSTDMDIDEFHIVPSRKRTMLDNSEIVRTDDVQKNVASNTDFPQNTKGNSEVGVNIPTEEDKDEEIVELAENDLRLILLAKRRRKSVDTGELAQGTETQLKEEPPVTSIKAAMPKEELPTKKKVSFSLDCDKTDLESVSSMPSEAYGYDTAHPQQQSIPDSFIEPYNVMRLRCLARDSCNKYLWYIVPDTQILMEHFAFIDAVVRLDSQCRLMVSHWVHSQLQSLSGGDSCGRPLAEGARRCLRLLADCQSVEREELHSNMSGEHGIVNCCMNLARDRYHVVLITDDVDLKHEAKISNIQTFTLQGLKNFISTEKEGQLDLSNIKITIIDNEIPREKPSIFDIQTKSAFKDQSSNEDKIPNQSVNKTIRCDESVNSIEEDINGQISKVVDVQTSPIIFAIKSTENVPISTTNMANSAGNHDNTTINMDAENDGQIVESNIIISFESPPSLPKDKVASDLWDLMNCKKGRSKIYQEIEKELKFFCEKNKETEMNFEHRMDELICCYVQTMEDALTNVLQNESNTSIDAQLLPPWYLHEALVCVKRRFQNDTQIAYVVEKLSSHVQKCAGKDGTLKADIKLSDFITIVGYGILLIRYLGERDSSNVDLLEAERTLRGILSPQADFTITHRDPEPDVHTAKLTKKPSDVLGYLKRHYPVWRGLDLSASSPTLSDANQHRDTVELAPNSEVKIVRTFGRDLKKLKFDNDKNMTVDKTPKAPTKQDNTGNFDEKENITGDSKTKIIRNVDAIKEFEGKLRSSIDVDALDYEESNNNVTETQTDTISNNFNKYLELSDNSTNISQYYNIHEPDIIITEHSDKNGDLIFNDDMSMRDKYTIDSGFETSIDGSQAFSLVKTFFTELKGFLMFIYNFIVMTQNEIQDGRPGRERRHKLRLKAKRAQRRLADVMDVLKSIIYREGTNSECTLKAILVKSGCYCDDIRITRYRQVVTKCLEQAEILNQSIRVIEGMMTNGTDAGALPRRAADCSRRRHCSCSLQSPQCSLQSPHMPRLHNA